MIRTSVYALVLLALCFGRAANLEGATFKLLSGESIEGTPVGPNEQGVVLKLADGRFSSRIGWTNFSQPDLKELAKNSRIKRYVEPLIEEETEAEEAAKGPVEIKIKTPPRAERPDPKAGFGALFSSGLGLFLMVLLYAANVYGAFEIAIFKARPPLLVCGLSAVAPLVGPLIFLLLPRWTPEEDEEMAGEEAAEEGDHAPVFQTPGMARAQAAASAHAPAAPAGAGGPPPSQVFLRGQFTFNRRFFETKLAGFMRVVPSEAEKDMVLHVKSARGEHVASRIARVTPNDVALQITKGGASAEVVVPFAEISEVRVQHKDA